MSWALRRVIFVLNPREFYFKAGTGLAVQAIAGFDFSAVKLDDVVNDGKSKSCATSVSAAALVYSEKSFKDALLVLFWDSVARVFDCNLYQRKAIL